MRRGTTPRIVVNVAADLTGWPVVHLAVKGESKTLVLDQDRLSMEYGLGKTRITATLTQEETLGFKAWEWIQIQVRARSEDGTAVATEARPVQIGEVIEDGVI